MGYWYWLFSKQNQEPMIFMKELVKNRWFLWLVILFYFKKKIENCGYILELSF